MSTNELIRVSLELNLPLEKIKKAIILNEFSLKEDEETQLWVSSKISLYRKGKRILVNVPVAYKRKRTGHRIYPNAVFHLQDVGRETLTTPPKLFTLGGVKTLKVLEKGLTNKDQLIRDFIQEIRNQDPIEFVVKGTKEYFTSVKDLIKGIKGLPVSQSFDFEELNGLRIKAKETPYFFSYFDYSLKQDKKETLLRDAEDQMEGMLRVIKEDPFPIIQDPVFEMQFSPICNNTTLKPASGHPIRANIINIDINEELLPHKYLAPLNQFLFDFKDSLVRHHTRSYRCIEIEVDPKQPNKISIKYNAGILKNKIIEYDLKNPLPKEELEKMVCHE